MVEIVSIAIAVVALIGTIVTAILQFFSNGVDCSGVRSNCCVIETDVVN